MNQLSQSRNPGELARATELGAQRGHVFFGGVLAPLMQQARVLGTIQNRLLVSRFPSDFKKHEERSNGSE